MSQTAKKIIFIGRVQGVGFRFMAFSIANRHQLTGQVRNLPNNTVEMIIQGNTDDIDNCIQDIRESFEDYVTETEIEEIPLNPQYKDFKITF
ncbi:MAG: acylphosphatase [Planctomycetes bacterium]|nr:acylphosphatase [Planctomycetota bacterium]